MTGPADHGGPPRPGVEIVTWTTGRGVRERVLVVDATRAPREYLGRADVVLDATSSPVRRTWWQAVRILAELPGCAVVGVVAATGDCVVLPRNRPGVVCAAPASTSRDPAQRARGPALRCYGSLCGAEVSVPHPEGEGISAS